MNAHVLFRHGMKRADGSRTHLDMVHRGKWVELEQSSRPGSQWKTMETILCETPVAVTIGTGSCLKLVTF